LEFFWSLDVDASNLHRMRVDLKIEDIAFGGKGVAREQGKAIFVPYTIEDELVSAEIVRELSLTSTSSASANCFFSRTISAETSSFSIV
jgi:tRNA/tmRNA/rRNA uracil-C5-methylase (TrmA/RlmC/RlmD family)